MEKSFEEKVAEAKAAVSALSPQDAKKRFDDGSTLFLDPRGADGIASTGIIPGALNVPLADLAEKADTELPAELHDKTRAIVTSCGGGPMGAVAAHTLKKRGFENVAFVDGGTQGWLDAGYSTDK